ncbi:acyltransferase family protein [Candidatus Peregrinibacteria bacterium]|nr:acyltransferase family protein [Candidatus Peregrinibacteria bacterium]
MNKQQIKKLEGFDGIRGIAALLVFLFHFLTLNQLDQLQAGYLNLTAFAKAGHIGLDIFFVLSGFLIFRSIYKNGMNKEYFQRRILRIAPIYYVALFVVIFLMHPDLLTNTAGRWDIFTHLLFIHSFDANTYYGINPVLWSLSVELLFYLFLPAFFILSRKKSYLILLYAIAMILGAYVYRDYMSTFNEALDSTDKIVFTENFIGRLDQFAFGIIASWACIKLNIENNWKKLITIVIGGIGLWLVFYGLNIFAELGGSFREVYHLHMFLHSLIALGTALFLYAIANTYSIIQKIVDNWILKFFGIISYSFYIWHFIIIEQLVNLETLSSKEIFIYSLLSVTALSAVTYYLIEKPALAKKKYSK